MRSKIHQMILPLAFFAFAILSGGTSATELSPRIAQMLADSLTDADSLVAVVVFLENHSTSDKVMKSTASQTMTRGERIRTVTETLKSYNPSFKNAINEYLNIYSTAPVVEHWIVPSFTAVVPVARLRVLSQMDGVKAVVENAYLVFEPPVSESKAPQSTAASISSQLSLLGVPSVWQRGLTGQGRLVCSFDTGVEESHPALTSKWRGNHSSLASSWFSKVAPDTLPYDKSGHGTHTMGIMVGSDAADSFGVAPGAEWITAGVIDQGRTLSVTISDILDAFQWVLDPDGNPTTTDDVPDVLLNSWGIPKGLFLPCDDTFWGAIDNVEAAGIVTIFAAGNEGPDPKTLRNPADRASTPLSSFAVGAVDNLKAITTFSSRGPSSCDSTQIKPEVVAPGVSIRSSYKGGTYMYMTGTSMAAPYIAGIVALLRQYNPDATVDQIKNALIRSAEDLGPTGEDNAYGNGLVNAERALTYIPSPLAPEFSIVSAQISDDGIALPGETFGLQLMLRNPIANVESVTGQILTPDKSNINVIADQSDFYFGPGGTTAINFVPFQISWSSTLYNGQQAAFQLILTSNYSSVPDTLSFNLTVGVAPSGNIASQSTSRLNLSVSDMGQFGFAPGSIYNVNGDGFRFDNSANLLYEAGLVIGRSSLQISSSIRRQDGGFRASDFIPVTPLGDPVTGSDGSTHRSAVITDTQSNIPIPINLRQETVTFDNVDDNGFMIVKYSLINNALEKLTNLDFGFFSDLDLSSSDSFKYNGALNLLYQTNASGLCVGVVALKNIRGFQTLANGSTKTGYSDADLFTMISTAGTIDQTLTGDLMCLTTAGPFSLNPGASIEVAFALVAGGNETELLNNAARAKSRYDLATDANDNQNTTLPNTYELSQNYPNPFNPTTTISFSLPTTSVTRLEVYNVLGQRVKTLVDGPLEPGVHQLEWDATDDHGSRVSSGIYFYRLQAGSFSDSRKMVLLK